MLGFAILVYACLSPFVSYDTYWHLKMGDDWLSSGLSPWSDHYSFTYRDHPVTNPPYLFQILLSFLVSILGVVDGLIMVKIMGAVLFLVASFYFLRKVKAPWPVITVIIPYICLFSLFRIVYIRPEILDKLLVVIALVLYLKARENFSNRNLLYIIVLQLFWVNYHVAILGYVIFFGLFLDTFVSMVQKQGDNLSWPRWLLSGIILFLIGFLNPGLKHPLIETLNFSNDWSQITEFHRTADIIQNGALLNLFWLICSYLVIVLVIQKQYGFAVVVAVFAFKSWQFYLLISISGAIIMLLLAYSLSRINLRNFLKQTKLGVKVSIVMLGMVLAISGLYMSLALAKEKNQSSSDHEYPVSVISYLKQAHPEGGRIFNQLRVGGYLLYHLSPEFSVYIDGRVNTLYPIEFLKNFATMFTAKQGDALAKEIERYKINYAIYPVHLGGYLLSNNNTPLNVEFVGKNSILFSNKQNNFPISVRDMYYPMCWHPSHQNFIAGEYHKAKEILPHDSVLLPIIESLNELNQSVAAQQFFDSMNKNLSLLNTDYHRRLMGYVAFELGLYKNAIDFFDAILKKQTLDLLMISNAGLKDQNYVDSEENLLLVLSESWAILGDSRITLDEQAIIVSLFEMIKAGKRLKPESMLQLESLKSDLLTKFPKLRLPLRSIVPRSNCKSLYVSLQNLPANMVLSGTIQRL